MSKRRLHTKRLAAFTLMELIIVMLISGVVLGLVYGLFNHSTVLFQSKNRQSQGYTELLALHTSLKSAFSKARGVEVKGQNVYILHHKTSLEYQLGNPEYIVRNSTRSDTFRLAHGALKLSLPEGAEDSLAIQSIEIPVYYHADTLKLFYHKGISINEMIRHEND